MFGITELVGEFFFYQGNKADGEAKFVNEHNPNFFVGSESEFAAEDVLTIALVSDDFGWGYGYTDIMVEIRG